MQDVYKAELERLQQEDVIIEVNHYTEWVNLIYQYRNQIDVSDCA